MIPENCYKKYICPHCNKGTVTWGGSKLYKCGFCGMTYNSNEDGPYTTTPLKEETQ